MKGSKFIGDTKGNRDMNHNLTQMNHGGSGEGHAGRPSSKFIGDTKGNRDLPIDRTSGVSMGHGGGKHKAGG
jgi:hypothetical protein